MSATRRIDGQTYFVNLPALVDGGLRAAGGLGAGWVPFEYELETLAGVGLATGAHSPAGDLVLNLGLNGWHRLHVAHNPAIRVWIEGEPGYCDLPGDPSSVREVGLPAADLTGRRLHIAPVRGAERSRELTLFFLRAEPCERPTGRRNMVVTNDGHGVFCAGLDTPRDLYRHLYPFRESDVFRMVWGVYGGGPNTLRPGSRFDDLASRSHDTDYYARDWTFLRSLQRFQAAGADPLAVVRQATREYGLELHYYFRMSAYYGPFPHLGWTTRFFAEHPQWRCRDEHGREVKLLSYAYPQVQDYVLDFFDELLDYEPEGICLAFNRGLPLMICEEPVIDAYTRRYGQPPRLPEACDSAEMLAVRHELLGDFVARAQALAAKRGKVISCIVPRDFENNRLLGLDTQTLVRRGLVESVMVGAGHGDDPALNHDLEPVQALKAPGTKVFAGGSGVRAHGQAWAGDLPARARHMAAIIDAGLDGGWFWDAESVVGLEWDAMRQFGDREMLAQIASGGHPARVHQTRRIHDLVVGRYNPWHAY